MKGKDGFPPHPPNTNPKCLELSNPKDAKSSIVTPIFMFASSKKQDSVLLVEIHVLSTSPWGT